MHGVFIHGALDTPDQTGIFIFPADLVNGFADDNLEGLLKMLIFFPEAGQYALNPFFKVRVAVLGHHQDDVAVADLKKEGTFEEIRGISADDRADFGRQFFPFLIEFGNEEAEKNKVCPAAVHLPDHVLHRVDVHRTQRDIVGDRVENIQHGDDRKHKGHRRQGRAAQSELAEAEQNGNGHRPVDAVHDTAEQPVMNTVQQSRQQNDKQTIADQIDIRAPENAAVLRKTEAGAGKRADDVDRDDPDKQQGGENGNEARLPALQPRNLDGIQCKEEKHAVQHRLIEHPRDINPDPESRRIIAQQRMIHDVDQCGDYQRDKNVRKNTEAARPADIRGQQQNNHDEAYGDNRHIPRRCIVIKADL